MPNYTHFICQKIGFRNMLCRRENYNFIDFLANEFPQKYTIRNSILFCRQCLGSRFFVSQKSKVITWICREEKK